MIARDVTRETDPHRRGLEFGRRHRESVQRTVTAYDRLFEAAHGLGASDLEAIGSRVASRLADAEPAIVAEIAGIAAGAEIPEGRAFALNARTEIFAGAAAPECSVIGVAARRSPEGALLAQNWDWHPDVADSLALWTISDSNGNWFTTFTEAGIVAKVGINSRGLAICINILASSADGGIGGMPIHILLRLLLERCSSHEDVEELIRSHSYSASTAISVAADEVGVSRLRTYEVWPGGVNVVEEQDGLLLHTNHFLGPTGDAVDVFRQDWPDTTERFLELGRLAAHDDPIDVDAVKSALRSHDAPSVSICCHDPENPRYEYRQVTLASVVMHLRDRQIELTDGSPCAAPYETFGPGS